MNNLLQKFLLGGSQVALLTAMPVSAAFAQSTDSSTGIEQVIVSGSRVTIAGYQQPTPVTVIGAAQLDSEAYANIQDSVRELPQVYAPPSSFSQSTGMGGPGQAGENLINLRNLGITRTLVLLDGQRVVASNLTGGVDITTLPTGLVQRVDVVTGGASAAWGSDAVAGVVNFVLNKNYTGFKANLQGGEAGNGQYRQAVAEADWGSDFAGGRGHFILAASMDYRPDQTPVVGENWFKGAYWVSNPAYAAGNGQPQFIEANNVGYANLTEGGIIISNPAGTGATAAAANSLKGIEFVGAGIPQTVNFGNVTSGALSNGGSLTTDDTDMTQQLVSIPSSVYTLFGYGRYKVTDTIQASVQLNYGYARSETTTGAYTTTSVVIASDNAYIPASVRAAMQAGGIASFTMGQFVAGNFNTYNVTPGDFTEMADSGDGPPIILDRRQMMRGVFSLDGSLGSDWSWNAYVEHSQARISIHVRDNPDVANYTAASDAVTVTTANRGTSGLALGSIACRSTLTGATVTVGNNSAEAGCIPLDVFGTGVTSAAAAAYVSAYNVDFQDSTLTQDVFEGSMQGVLPWQLPAGPVAVAFGAGYRKEAAKAIASTIGSLAGFGNANYSPFPTSSYNILEGFAEVDAPLLKNTLVESLDATAAGRMTSYSTSGLVETWKLGLTSQVIDDVKLRTTWSVDIRAPNLAELYLPSAFGGSSGKDPKTNLTVQYVGNTTGNPNLVPEVARTVSGGVVLTPTFLPGMNLSADWYSINVTGEIASISAATILNQCNPTAASTIYPGTNGSLSDPLCKALVFAGVGGALSGVNVTPINIASQTTSGLDLQGDYTMDFWEGTLNWRAVSNYTDETTLTQPGAGVNDSVGTGTSSPKWRGTLSANYLTGPYSFTIQGRWFGTTKQSNTGNTGNLTTAATANLYPTNLFEVPFVAYMDLRASYKWNQNVQIYGAIDNATDVPPPLIPTLPSNQKPLGNALGTNPTVYDLLGRVFRVGVRFNY